VLYDPRELGALCDQCALEGAPIVPSEGAPSRAVLGIVAEAPGLVEEALAQPLVGMSGQLTEKALNKAGLKRYEVFLTNVCLCRPTETSMRGHYSWVKARNAKRAKAAQKEGTEFIPLLPGPVACRPRLMNELMQVKGGLLLMGAFARQTLYPGEGGENKLMSSRGFPSWATIEVPGGYSVDTDARTMRCLSTIHPAYALRVSRWVPFFEMDVDKAVRMVRDQLRYREPEMLFDISPDRLVAFLQRLEEEAPSAPIAADVETKHGLDWSRPDALRVFGIGNSRRATAIQFQSCQQPPREIYTPREIERFGEILVNWAADEKGKVVGQNFKFDRNVCENSKYLPGWALKRRVIDTAVMHHVAWSEMPHNLAFLAAQYTDSPAWKGKDHDAWDDDREYHTYNMLDIANTSSACYAMAQDKILIDQKVVLQGDMKLSSFCQGMEQVGIPVDRVEQENQKRALNGEMVEAKKKVDTLLVRAGEMEGGERIKRELAKGWQFSPGSPDQIRYLLYNLLGYEPFDEKAGGWTDTGLKSVAKPILFLMIDRGLPRLVEDIILSIIDYREAQKLKGTYCKASPWPDGRVHPTWNPHVVVSGRLSCSPNLMNIRKSLRAIYCAPPGHLFVAWDKRQLEARVTAWLAQQLDQIEAFLQGADIHKVNAVALFGLGGVDEVTKELRQFTKTFVYAAQYLAGVKKIHQMIRTFRNDKGQRPYSDYAFKDAQVCYERMWRNRAAIMAFHEANRALWVTQGYLASAKWGRRRYFADGTEIDDDKEEKANHIIQSTSADDVNEATERLVEAFPWGFDGPGTGIVHQCHDSLMAIVRENNALEVGKRGVQILDSMLGDMPLPVDLAIGRNYRDLEEIKL